MRHGTNDVNNYMMQVRNYYSGTNKWSEWFSYMTNASLVNVAETNYIRTNQNNYAYNDTTNYYSVKNGICTISVMITAQKDVADAATEIGTGLPKHTGKASYNFCLIANDLKDVLANVNPIDAWITSNGILRVRGGKNAVKYSGTLTYPVSS